MKAKHLILIGAALISAPFIYHYASAELIGKTITVCVVISCVVVAFECALTALRDFGGFRD